MTELPDCIERSVLIEAPLAHVWNLIVDPSHLARWYPGARIEPRAGAAATFDCGADDVFHGIVDRVAPPHVLAWRWCLEPGVPVDDGPTSRVEITLVSEGGATRLNLAECGFAGWSDADRARIMPGNAGGWVFLLDNLATIACPATP